MNYYPSIPHKAILVNLARAIVNPTSITIISQQHTIAFRGHLQ